VRRPRYWWWVVPNPPWWHFWNPWTGMQGGIVCALFILAFWGLTVVVTGDP
jgi:hypothetical protein